MEIHKDNDEKIIKEVTRAEQDFIEARVKEYTAQGASIIEAGKMASEDWAKTQEAVTDEQAAAWDKLTQSIGLADLLKDQLIRALSNYKDAYHAKFPEKSIDFNLQLKTKGVDGHYTDNKRLIAQASLSLEFSYNGVWTVWRNKSVKFQHIREMRDGHRWKLALYESMLHDLIAWGVTNVINVQELKNLPKATSNEPDSQSN